MRYKKGHKDLKYNQAKLDYLETNKTLREICCQYSIDRHSFSKYLKTHGISIRKKISSNDRIFEKIDTEEKAYWLGFLYADGSVTYKSTSPTNYRVELGLQLRDLSHIEKFKVFLNSNRPIDFKEKTNSYRISILSKKLCEDLIKLGCFPKKSLILKFPTNEQVPQELLPHFIRGYFDGDGYISISENKFKTCGLLGTKEFLQGLIDLLKFDTVLKKDSRHLNNTYYISLNVTDSIVFLKYMYQNNHISLQRKQETFTLAVKCRNVLKYERAISEKGEIPNTEINKKFKSFLSLQRIDTETVN